jgi:hypothetical protein
VNFNTKILNWILKDTRRSIHNPHKDPYNFLWRSNKKISKYRKNMPTARHSRHRSDDPIPCPRPNHARRWNQSNIVAHHVYLPSTSQGRPEHYHWRFFLGRRLYSLFSMASLLHFYTHVELKRNTFILKYNTYS